MLDLLKDYILEVFLVLMALVIAGSLFIFFFVGDDSVVRGLARGMLTSTSSYYYDYVYEPNTNNNVYGDEVESTTTHYTVDWY